MVVMSKVQSILERIKACTKDRIYLTEDEICELKTMPSEGSWSVNTHTGSVPKGCIGKLDNCYIFRKVSENE